MVARRRERHFSDVEVETFKIQNHPDFDRLIRPENVVDRLPPPQGEVPLGAEGAADPYAGLGLLMQHLPTEIVLEVLKHLDLQALGRICQTSRGARSWVRRWLPDYAKVLASDQGASLVAALAATGMLRQHSLASLKRVMLLDGSSARCASCRTYYGGFMFLPTLERACHFCREENMSLHMCGPSLAATVFRLAPAQVETLLPVMRTVAGRYGGIGSTKMQAGTRLVAVRDAKLLAMRVHGVHTSEDLIRLLRQQDPRPEKNIKPDDRNIVQCNIVQCQLLRETPLEHPGHDISLDDKPMATVNDPYAGMAYMRMPGPKRKPDGSPDLGVLCRCCSVYSTPQKQRQLTDAGTVPEKAGERPFKAMKSRLWLHDEFKEHLQECYFMPQPWA